MRNIVYLHALNFFTTATRQNRRLESGRPLIVVKGSTVFAACAEASAWGVRPGISRSFARRVCPQAIFADYCENDFAALAAALRQLGPAFTPLVEPHGFDGVFLDLTGAAPWEEVWPEIRRRAEETLAAPLVAGVASSPFVARLAALQATPGEAVMVSAGEEAAFLSSLPIESAWRLPAETILRLCRLGLRTIGEVAAHSEVELLRQLGPAGKLAATLARGEDCTPVRALYPPAEIAVHQGFAEPTTDHNTIKAALAVLANQVVAQLHGLLAGRLSLTLEGQMAAAAVSRFAPTAEVGRLAHVAEALLEKISLPGQAHALALSAGELTTPRPQQLCLFSGPGGITPATGDVQPRAATDRPLTPVAVLDKLREELGPTRITLGSTLIAPRRERALSLLFAT